MVSVQPGESPSPETSKYHMGQEISDKDVEEIFRTATEVGVYDRRDVVLSDGFEASLDVIGKERYRIREMWKAGEDPCSFSN